MDKCVHYIIYMEWTILWDTYLLLFLLHLIHSMHQSPLTIINSACNCASAVPDAVKAHCCIHVTGNEGLLSIIAAAGVHNEVISRTFWFKDLSQLVQTDTVCCHSDASGDKLRMGKDDRSHPHQKTRSHLQPWLWPVPKPSMATSICPACTSILTFI